MFLLAQFDDGNIYRIAMIVIILFGLFAGLVIIAVMASYFRLWIQSVSSNAGIGIFDLIGMSFRKVRPEVIVRSKIMAVQAGLGEETGLTSKALEAHYLAGGNVPLVIRAIIAANKAKNIPLDFRLATAIDLAGRNVLEAVQTSVYPKVIESNLAAELPFMATEEILMAGVRAGGDRQDLHERIRVHSVAAAREVKEQGRPNDLMDRLKSDPAFAKVDLTGALDARRFVGRAPEQVEGFLREVVGPVRERYAGALGGKRDELRV